MLTNSLDFLDSFIGNSDDLKKRCVDVFERLAKHTESSVKGTESRDICWVMLARLLFRCDEETLRTLGSRVSKRLVDVTRQPMSMAILVFIRAAVDRIPALMAQNQKTLRGLCLSVLDFGVLIAYSESNCDTLELAIDTFAACFGFSESNRILNTLKVLLDGSVISEASSDHLIFIDQIKFTDRRNLLIKTMFILYRRSLQKAKKEKLLDLGAFLNLAERALRIDNTEITSAVLISLGTVVRRCRFGVLLYGPTILSLLMERVLSNEVACTILTEMNELFGVSSNISKHPDFTLLTKIGCWIDTPHALQISELLSSVLRSSSFTIKRHAILETQHSTCSLLLKNGPSLPLIKILNTFLLLNHEQIPVPIQIIRTLTSRWSSIELESSISQEIRRCRAICDSIAHPRIQLLSNVKDTVAQICIDADNERKEEEIEAALMSEKKQETVAEQVKADVATTGSQTEKVEQEEVIVSNSKRSIETAPSTDIEQPQPAKKTKVVENDVPAQEVEFKESTQPMVKPKMPKNKPKLVNPPNETLAEGEISVEDMLLDFCP